MEKPSPEWFAEREAELLEREQELLDAMTDEERAAYAASRAGLDRVMEDFRRNLSAHQ